MKELIRKNKIFVLLLGAAAVCFFCAARELYFKPAEAVTYLERDPAGGTGKNVELQAVVEGGEALKVELNVPAARFTDAEAKKYFDDAVRELNARFSGEENGAVRQDLTLPASLPDNPVRIEWQSSHPWILSSEGKIGTPDAAGEKVTLTATLFLDDREDKYIASLTVFPPEDSRGIAGALADEAEELNAGSSDGNYYLPDEFAGHKVAWYGTAGSRAGTLAVILLLAALILAVRKRKQTEERIRKRNEALKASYPELISMVLLLSCAGLTVRRIMYRIAAMPGEKERKGTKKACAPGKTYGFGKTYGAKKLYGAENVYEAEKSYGSENVYEAEKSYGAENVYEAEKSYGAENVYGPAFEEIGKVCADLDRGLGEPEAYERLGTRCAGAGYRTFAMLLARSTVRGSAGLQAGLEQEAQAAFEDARRRAKAAGDMAAVKLLLPMAMMLAVVMIIVLVPSFLSFTQ